MVLPGNTSHLAGYVDTYAMLKFSQKGDNGDPLNCWLPYITSSFASIPYASNTTQFSLQWSFISPFSFLILFFFQ